VRGCLGEVALLHQAVEHKVDVIEGNLAVEFLGNLLSAVVTIEPRQDLTIQLAGEGVIILLTQQVNLLRSNDLDMIVRLELKCHCLEKE
jgi:hypothetical protein